MILLTFEARKAVLEKLTVGDSRSQAIAKAQAKKILEWGDEGCRIMKVRRHLCGHCWQQLKKEIEESHTV